jgi:hypothetical protein
MAQDNFGFVPKVVFVTDAEVWTSARKELLAWLQRNAPSLAELYEGTLCLMFSTPPLPGRVRLIAHAVREISNRLPDAFVGVQKTTRLDYSTRLDQLSDLCRQIGFNLDGQFANFDTNKETGTPSQPDVSIPRVLFMEIANLMKDHETTHSKPLDAAKRLFEAIAPESQSLGETALQPTLNQWLRVNRWFMRNAHDSGKLDAEVDGREIQMQFELFEACLGALVRGFFNTIEELDEILEDANS